MTRTDDKALAGLAADFPGWHMWRSRDTRGRDASWNATRRRRPGRGALGAGVLGRLTADSAAGLRGQLEQQRAVEPGSEQVA
ncbi:MAG TPA: hypothetical protein VMG13_14865 [Trebonia sp.]|nr:hypothetical protein [Trebonia sp.]